MTKLVRKPGDQFVSMILTEELSIQLQPGDVVVPLEHHPWKLHAVRVHPYKDEMIFVRLDEDGASIQGWVRRSAFEVID